MPAIAATILFRSEFGLAGLAARDNNLRVEYLGPSVTAWITINFVIAAVLRRRRRRLRRSRSGHIDPDFAFWTTSGEFVFLAILAGYQSVTAVFVAAFAGTGALVFQPVFSQHLAGALGIFLLVVILFLPRGSARWTASGAYGADARRRPSLPRKDSEMTALPERGLEKDSARWSPPSDYRSLFERGQKLGLIGNNGAGKTTFINIVTGHLKPNSGRVP